MINKYSLDSVESAGVPSGLQKLAKQIKQIQSHRELFVEATVKDAENWLKQNLASEIDTFLDNFGHRCLKEFELMSKPWSEVMSPVVVTLQTMLSQPSQPDNKVSLLFIQNIAKNLKFSRIFKLLDKR